MEPDKIERDEKLTEEELALARKERDEYLAGWKRAKADLVNFRKENERASGELADAFKARFVGVVLPVLDALEESGKSEIEGLDNVHALLVNILKKEGIEEIEIEDDEKFNPARHESVGGEGEIIDEVVQKGYKYKNRVIRPVKVKVKKASQSYE